MKRSSLPLLVGGLVLAANSAGARPAAVSIPSPLGDPMQATVYVERLAGEGPIALSERELLGPVKLPWNGVVEVSEKTRTRVQAVAPATGARRRSWKPPWKKIPAIPRFA